MTVRFAAGCVLAALCLSTAVTTALPRVQSTRPVEVGTAVEIHSEVLNETRVLNVLLPPGYGSDEEKYTRYPVIYLLDGAVDEDYHHVSGLVRFLTDYRLMPPSILIGIANADRTRDMTFPSADPEAAEKAPTHGGSEAFRRFLAEELQPLVREHYRTGGRDLLVGQSLAGLLATEVLVHDPALFDDYVIVSPSLWWDEFSLVEKIEPSLRDRPDLAVRVCIVVGDEGSDMEGPAHALAAALAGHASETLRWQFLALPEETHATILHRGLYRALEWLYGDEYSGL